MYLERIIWQTGIFQFEKVLVLFFDTHRVSSRSKSKNALLSVCGEKNWMGKFLSSQGSVTEEYIIVVYIDLQLLLAGFMKNFHNFIL